MASMFRSGSSRRKAEAPGKIRIQFKKTSKAHKDSDVDENDDENGGDDDDENLPVNFGNGVSDDLPEGVGQPEPAEDTHAKKKHPPTRIDTSVLESICCSACGRQLNPYKNGAVQKHAQLKVIICKHCSKFLSSGEISKDQDGADEQCRWCGEGGRLLVCDDCSSAFCKSCVMRNFSRSEFNNINSQDNWLCYLCNQKPLKSLQENYRKIRDTLKALQEKQKAKLTGVAASPANTSSPHSKKNVDGKPDAKQALFTSNNKGGSAVANNVCSETPMTLLSSEDLNVGHENVNATIDKLTTATNTLRDVLQALRSQTISSTAGAGYTEQKRKQQARALNKSLETFLRSLKTILTDDVADERGGETQVQNAAPVKSTASSLGPKSHLSSRSTTTSGGLPKEMNATQAGSKSSKKSVVVQQISTESNGGLECVVDITQALQGDTHRSKNSDKTNSVVDMNGDITKKKSSVISSSESSKGTKDSEATPSKNSPGGSKNRKKDDDKEHGDEESTDEEDTVANSEKACSQDKSEGVDNNNESSQSDSKRSKSASEEAVKETLNKEAVSENGGEAEEDGGASVEPTEKDKTVSSTPDDENLAAKFDLIKEIADEITRDDRELDKENEDNEGNGDNVGEEEEEDDDDDDLPITFGGEPKSTPDSETKTSKRKKAEDSSSEDTPKTLKKSKKPNSSDVKKSAKETDNKKVKQDKKPNQDSEVDESSSDPLSSGNEDTAPSTRRKTRKATAGKETRKSSRKDTKATSPKQSAAKTKKRSEKAEKPSEVDEIDKEIAKLAKLPTMRKRKAADADAGEENVEEKEDASDEVKEKPVKRAKPGPKSSKKGVDYDDLSSDGHEGKDDDDDVDEDEDELPVTFFGNTEEADAEQGLDENEIAKKGLLEEGLQDESENDDNEEAEGDSSSDEESDKESTKKIKKEKKKKEPALSEEIKQEDNTNSEKDDSDENIGKRKKVHSKLLDAKLSDSDSDIGSKKKKKNDDDYDAGSKSESSSGSSSGSDLSDDDDSEDSEDDDSDTKSKKKGKKKGKKGKKGKGKKNEDDESSEEDGKKSKKGKGKKRKRIKKMSNSSDDGGGSEGDLDDGDDDDPNSSKAGRRKQIRKVMSSKRLEDSTRAAAKAEEKRRKRIAAKQREFNVETITDENNPLIGQMTTKLVLEAGKEEGDEPIVQVSKKLVRKLKPHQVEGVQFLWDCLYESVKRAKKGDGAGCILAHCMGLGKTLSVIAFVHTILTHEKVLKHRTCLIVSPLNTVLNWKNEWSMWFDEDDRLEVWELAGCKQNALRAKALRDWQESGGIMIIGYEMYRNLTTGSRCKNKKQKATFQETLVNPGPDLVICDEGHILKNEASAISKAMNQMRTRRRVVLTGTPLQNNLTEYHCMLSFVKPNLLGTRKEFTNRFISPIQNGQCTDSTQGDFKLMKARAHVLHEMLAGCVQRRDYSALTKFLPPKQEYVISVRLTSIQIELYDKYLELTGQGVDGVFTNKGARLFKDYQNLMKIWTHPWVLKLAEIRDELKAKYDDEDSFIDDEDSEEEMSFSSSSSSSDDDKAGSDSAEEGTSSKAKAQKGTRRTRAKARRDAGEDSDPEEVITEWKSKSRKEGVASDVEEQDTALTRDWWAAYVTEDDQLKLELSNKLSLLFEILRMCEEIGDKVLIFSQSILSLNIIESFLEVIDAKFQQECENLSEEEREKQGLFGRSWTKNLDYYRMDGTTGAQQRHNWASSFNDIDNYRARLFLISTRAGGLGINLVAANRVIIFDASWNPSHDVQSIFRVYRFGQTKPCYIYRFLAQGTMEEKIYERQVTKLSLSQRVVDEHQIERHFSANDLKELYNFRPDRWDDGTEKPTLSLPKDPLLAEILTNNKQCVVSFHEHDSLLENQVEQTLTEEEKKAAWEEYENEKKGIVIRGPGMDGKTSSWPMMAAAQLLSREQIAATVHALRQQLPDVSENLFQLHLQQALRRQVQIKQEEMKRLELMRLQELNYLNMMKQHGGMSRSQIMQNMPWLQQMRALQQNAMLMGGSSSHMGMNQTAAGMNWPAQTSNNTISNKPEEAIDLDDN